MFKFNPKCNCSLHYIAQQISGSQVPFTKMQRVEEESNTCVVVECINQKTNWRLYFQLKPEPN